MAAKTTRTYRFAITVPIGYDETQLPSVVADLVRRTRMDYVPQVRVTIGVAELSAPLLTESEIGSRRMRLEQALREELLLRGYPKASNSLQVEQPTVWSELDALDPH